MAMERLKLAILNPDRMWQTGDMGLVRAINYRARLRGLEIDWIQVNFGEHLDADGLHGILCGGRSLHDAETLIADFKQYKLAELKMSFEEDIPFLALGSAFAICCHQFEHENNVFMSGLDLFHVESRIRPSRSGGLLALWAPWLSDAYDEASDTAVVPQLDELTLEDASRPELILGYERHDSLYCIPHPNESIGHVLFANKRIKARSFDGVKMGKAMGTFMQGHVLALNPSLTDNWLQSCLDVQGHERLKPVSAREEDKVRETILGEVLAL